MVNYPNLKKAPANMSIPKKSTSKHYTAFRGMSLEEDINLSNTYYLSVDQAVIYKKPTPIQIVKVDYPSRNKARIVEAYYHAPSTTDYNGIYKGRYIDFEAKETKSLRFPFRNISEHQINHLARVSRHGGIAFIIIAFTSVGEVYLLDASIMVERFFHDKKQHISYDEVKESGHLIKQGYQPRLAYLDVIDEFYLKEDTL